MDPTTLLNKPRPRVTAHITKINSLVDSSDSIKKSSTKLRKVFEKGTYQKKTQLSILNRYKRRLDSIQKQNDRRFAQKKQVKIKPPDIKKYAGSLFTAGSTSDPLKAIGALAAFNAASKLAKGDWMGAVGPGLVTAGIFLGPALLGGVGNMMRRGGGGGAAAGTPGSSATSSPWWSKNTKSLGRANESYAKFIKGEANLGDRARLLRRGQITPTQALSRGGSEVLSKQPGKVAKAFGRFGKSIVPVAGAALGAIDATLRAQEGDVTGASIAGTSASLDALAAASAATGIGLPVAGLLSIASFGLDVVNLVRDLSGASEKESQRNKATQPDKLKKQTEQQKKLVEKKKESKGELTFSKTLDRYERVVNKFEKISKEFKSLGKETLEQTQRRARNVENLIGDQDIIAEPGYEFTNYTAQYLTGDPSSPAYDESHGTSSNYHDHIAFRDRDMAIRAYQYLESKGLDVTEFQGFDAVGGHSEGSYHYSGLAFDVPGYQWGATGPIDERHYNGSRIVRRYLNEFFQQEKQNNPNLEQKTSSSRRRPPAQPPQQISPLFQQPQTQTQRSAGLSVGSGGFNIGGRPVSAQMTTPRTPSRPIATNLPYQSGYSEPTIVPYPVVQQLQQQLIQQGSSEPVIISGPSEEQLLNSFYKKVLLNTLN
jgi:hypothetical protein